MELMSPIDSLFLAAESREHPLHVGSLQLFSPPTGAGRGFVREIHQAMLKSTELAPLFRKRPMGVHGAFSNFGWTLENDVDLDYHVRRSALPTPGRVRELLELTSRLHSNLLDRHRPLWETHLIEGLKDGRFAIYSKIHHALVDGVSGLSLMRQSMSADPDVDEFRTAWAPAPQRASRHRNLRNPLRQLGGVLGSVAGLAPSTARLARAALLEQQLTLPFGAPRTMLNVSVGGARRCAAQSWELDRVKAIKDVAGVSLNDVVLAMCAGALRAYLEENEALPDAPLVAMVPVNLRNEGDAVGGNRIGAVLCNLATDRYDPADRLESIHNSMYNNKKVMSQLPRAQAMALSLTMLSPAALNTLPGLATATPPPFNVCISNVPGSREPLYLKGARLVGSYPMSLALNGQALNITLTSTVDTLDFGLVGCRRSIPHLQRLLSHLETSLKELERAVGL
ncbi:wax ester/triacylglycerol synthase family O-acyltransferase [Mycobacterium intermedium]|uniref:Diacylglycerol O-acyltransferase n=2 Tax=Mycobacterium intermedium TaxID=28445 RepID=A0A1E3SJR9_MYCIE|nr:diacylglycerol O-acyltransferase [Mycobacterium intermedium]OPE52817.1 diacylglycerol O-acyltransferase [Mycobacterium intermedium]ORA96743.1 wax ester/triacylglycerol synthase family O-acyltransferase [Mycobacterium intermedium]